MVKHDLDIRKVDPKKCSRYFERLSNYHETLPVIINNFVQPPLLEYQLNDVSRKEEYKNNNQCGYLDYEI